MQFSTRLGGALLLLLLGACRSQQSTFSFQPTTNASAPVEALTSPAAAVITQPAEAEQPITAARHTHAHPKSLISPVTARKATRNSRTTQFARLKRQRHQEAAGVSRPRQATRHDALHIVLGALLVVGGVVAGLALGGWLGVGVGAVIVLLGYYFVVLGIGGKHAWLEIFQEFFNM